jgi:hypothetical protein
MRNPLPGHCCRDAIRGSWVSSMEISPFFPQPEGPVATQSGHRFGGWHDARKPATPKDVCRDGALLR